MMGMYTELVIKCKITSSCPNEVDVVLRHLFNGASKPVSLPKHKFFDCYRWDHIGTSCSFYHTPFALSRYSSGFNDDRRGGHIFSRSDLKNYGDEIELFVDWLMPYIDEEVGQCIGWSWYEEDNKPRLLFKE